MVVVTMECGAWDLSSDMQIVSIIGTCKSTPALRQMRELEACIR